VKALSVIDRILLVVYTFALGIISIILVLVAAGWKDPLGVLTAASATDGGRLTLAVIGVLLVVANVRLAAVAFAGGWRRRQIVHELAMGSVRVSLSAVEGFVSRLARAHPGVKEASSAIRLVPDGIAVYVRATVGPEVEIARLSDELQQSVRAQVKQVVGITVEAISIDIDHISPRPSRVSRVDR